MKVTVKRYNTTGWESVYPKTTLDQVIDLSSSLANMQSEIDGKITSPSQDPSNGQYLRGDGVWATPPNTNTTYSNFKGSTSTSHGSQGLVPGPTSSSIAMFLKSNGTWGTMGASDLPNHSHDYVPTSRTINGYALNNNVSLKAGDVGARPDTWIPAWSQISGRPEGFVEKISFIDGTLVLGGL